MSVTPSQNPTPFNGRLILGLVGVLLAALTSGVNDRVTEIALIDLLGQFGLGHDEGSWITTVYAAAEVSAMLLAAWLAVTFSLRRFAIVACIAFGVLGIIMPFAPNFELLLVIRALQGLAGGALVPILMTAALRFLPWNVKLYGLSAYALTATFGPNIATPLASLWTEGFDWKMVFWQIIPTCFLAAGLIAYGIPQDPLRLERFKQADWRGALLGVSGLSMLIVAVTQGERLDWFHSPMICALLVGAVVCLPLFLVNEWRHPLPLFKLQLLGRRNFSFGIITLCLFLFLSLAGGALPTLYLVEIQGYRPLQVMPTTLIIAALQLALAPLVAFALNRTWVDSRYIMGTGLILMGLACFGGAHLTSEWIRDDFYILQVLHAFGQPMIVVPLLMNATGTVHPLEGPFASSMVNTMRGLFAVLGGSALENFITHREHFHSNKLTDALGSQWPNAEALHALVERLSHQSFVLSFSDAYLALIAIIAVLLLILITLPQRAYPPQPPVH